MTFVLYAHGHRSPDQYPRDHIVKFHDPAHAKVWLQEMEHNLPEGFTVRSQQMDAICAAADTDWQLPDERLQWILRFKYGTWDEVHVKDEPEVAAAKKASSPQSPRSKREAKAQRPDGYVTITELCNASGVAACDARATLRASGREKPSFGWAFAPNEIKAIKKLCGIK
jgi:hypothetical protein